MEYWNLYGLVVSFIGTLFFLIPSPIQTGVPPRWAFLTGVLLLSGGFLLQLISEVRQLFF